MLMIFHLCIEGIYHIEPLVKAKDRILKQSEVFWIQRLDVFKYLGLNDDIDLTSLL